jgi:hypothetical protein
MGAASSLLVEPEWVLGPAIYQRLGISPSTWARWVKAGVAPAPIAGLPGFPKWRAIDIDRFAEGTFRSPGKRTYFTHAQQLRNEQAVMCRVHARSLPTPLARVK